MCVKQRRTVIGSVSVLYSHSTINATFSTCNASSAHGVYFGRRYGKLKANSHMPCRAHAVPLPCLAALIHTCHGASLSFSDNAVSS
jgi:hypothetical protein